MNGMRFAYFHWVAWRDSIAGCQCHPGGRLCHACVSDWDSLQEQAFQHARSYTRIRYGR